jgi:hypothetical protein
VRYRFPLSFIVLTTIVIALRAWIEHDSPRPPLTDATLGEDHSNDLVGADRNRLVYTPENSRLAEQTPGNLIVVADIAATANALNSPETTADNDLEILESIIEFYRRANGDIVPSGGLNEEIVRRMRGDNDMKLAVFPDSHPSLNARGQLLDRWGTPYYFHPVSHAEIEIRSAGPDGKLWTNDDISRGESQDALANSSQD